MSSAWWPNESNKGTSRRSVVKGAAWSLPVIAIAVAAPAASASEAPVEPVACHKIKHAGNGGHVWVGTYSDGTSVTMTNGEAMSGEFGPICRASGTTPGAGDGGTIDNP